MYLGGLLLKSSRLLSARLLLDGIFSCILTGQNDLQYITYQVCYKYSLIGLFDWGWKAGFLYPHPLLYPKFHKVHRHYRDHISCSGWTILSGTDNKPNISQNGRWKYILRVKNDSPHSTIKICKNDSYRHQDSYHVNMALKLMILCACSVHLITAMRYVQWSHSS